MKTTEEIISELEAKNNLEEGRHKRRMEFWGKYDHIVGSLALILGCIIILIYFVRGILP